MTRWLRDVQAALGRTATVVAFAAVAAGAAGFATGLAADERPRTYAALIASWLFFAGVAAGALAFRALFRIVGARWARPLARLGGAQIGFAPVALLVLLVIVVGADFAPWRHPDPSSSWMSVAGLAIRELVLTAVLFGCGLHVSRRRDRADGPTAVSAVVYCLAFAIVLSMWAFDFVLGADATFESTLIGPYVFIAAFIAGTASVTLVGLARGALAENARRDAGALILALSIFWAYLFWAQYLTIWYGNLPDEIGFALRRADAGWGVVVLVVIGLVFVLPFVTLLHPAGRRSARVLGAVLALQLLGLWLDCHLLIVPSLTPRDAPALGVRDVVIALGLFGAFALSVARRLKATPTTPTSQGANPGGARVDVLTPERTAP